MRWVCIGNPDNRRVRYVQEAVRNTANTMQVLSWLDVIADPTILLGLSREPTWLRIESAGEDDRVQTALLRRVGIEGAPQHGELLHPGQAHRSFVEVLEEIDHMLRQRLELRPLAKPERIAWVFDKSRFHEDCRAEGIAVAPRLEVQSYDELVAQMSERGIPRVFVKLRHGSSASGLGLYHHGTRPALMTTVQRRGGQRFNTLRVQRVDAPSGIREVLDFLFAEGAHVEEAVRKARFDGAFCDCRVLMINHEPRFVVLRQNRHPITNLHLLGWRGDIDRFRAACGEASWERAMEDCRRVSRLYGGLHVGVDVLFRPGLQSHCILEANAFGDLLPGLLYDGQSVYETEVAEIDRWYAAE